MSKKIILGDTRLLLVWAFKNYILSEEDKKLAKEHNIIIMDENSVQYYLDVIKSTGTVANIKFSQSTCDEEFESLKTVVPAIKTKDSNHEAFIFTIKLKK